MLSEAFFSTDERKHLIMAAKQGGRVRSAVDGKFKTPEYGKAHPKTTVVEHPKPTKKK